MNFPFIIYPPILQKGKTPYSGFSSNQDPVISMTVPPSVRPLVGSIFFTKGYL